MENSSERPQPTFDDTINRAVAKFLQTETIDSTVQGHADHGKPEMQMGYCLMDAASDLAKNLRNEGVNMHRLAGIMMDNTNTTPDLIDWGLYQPMSWDDVSEIIVGEIIKRELPLKHPELIKEDKRRQLIGPK